MKRGPFLAPSFYCPPTYPPPRPLPERVAFGTFRYNGPRNPDGDIRRSKEPTMTPLDVAKLRGQIPALRKLVYLNTGGSGPLPRAVAEEIAGDYRALLEEGPDVPAVRDAIAEKYERCRDTVARFFSVTPEEIAFTRSVSEGLSAIAYGMDWSPGDEVVVTSEEHPSGIMVWLNLAERRGIAVKKLPLVADRDELLARLESIVTDRTRLIAVSHVTTDTGLKLPATEICSLAHQRGIAVAFDAAHSAGQFPIDLREVDADFYLATGRKWLLGGWGAAMMYVRKEWIAKLKVSATGLWAGTWDHQTDELRFFDTAHRFEYGDRHMPVYNGMAKGIEFVASVGLANVETRVKELTARLKAAIEEIPGVSLRSPEPPEMSTGIVTFSVEGLTGVELSNQMWERWRILGRRALDETAMRVCVAFFTSDEEIEVTVSAMSTLANENRRR